MDIKIITDTAADMTKDEIEKFSLTVMDMPVIMNGETEPVKNLDEFWAKINDGKFARTSQPSPEDFRTEFENAKNGGYAVILIVISDKLSATYESACFIKEQVGYEHIYIVNSLYATYAEKTLVYQAVRLKEEGLCASEIYEKLLDFRSKIRLYASPETLTHLARGGRISKAVAAIGNLISLKLLMRCDENGFIICDSKVIGMNKAIAKMVENLSNDKFDDSYPLFIFYAENDKNAVKLAEKLKSKGFNVDEKYFMPMGATIGTHVGPGAFGLAYVKA